MLSYWSRNGPPLPIAVRVVGQSLGIDWKAGSSEPGPSAEAPAGPSIAELAATARPLL